MMSDHRFETALAAGERLFQTVEHGNLEELRTIFSDGAMIWHNTDEKLTDVETTIRNLQKLRSGAQVFRYTEIRREPTLSGFVQQHTLIVQMADGRQMRDVACCICRVDNGRISHMDAYHDSAVVNGMVHRQVADS
jgi:ketosteroid isomerase-like protein